MSGTRATVRGPKEGRAIHTAGNVYRFLVEESESDGRLAAWDSVVPPGSGPPEHVHSREAEAFFIYEGELELRVDGETHRAPAGSFVYLPEGVPHVFTNPTDKPARVLAIVAPGGMEQMFVEVGKEAADPDAPAGAPDDDEIARLRDAAPRYGVTLLGPPLSSAER